MLGGTLAAFHSSYSNVAGLPYWRKNGTDNSNVEEGGVERT